MKELKANIIGRTKEWAKEDVPLRMKGSILIIFRLHRRKLMMEVYSQRLEEVHEDKVKEVLQKLSISINFLDFYLTLRRIHFALISHNF